MKDLNKINVIKISISLLFLILFSYSIANVTTKIAAVVTILPLVFVILLIFSKKYYLVLNIMVVTAFLIPLLIRYIGGVPYGLLIDFFLLYIGVSLIFNKKISIEKNMLNNPLIIISFLWFLVSLISFFNPLSTNKIAWLYANRAFSIYSLMIIFLVLQFFRDQKMLDKFLTVWGIMAVFGTLWGIKQLFFGVSATEQQWLDAGARSTHVLWGRLRVFSFFTDASQFAAHQAHTALVFGILGISQKKMSKKILYILFSLITLYGLIISGSRGPLAIVFVGILVYIIMLNRVAINFWSLLILSGAFVFLKFTFIGQSVYQINRMRTALNPENNPSFQIRMDRIEQLTAFMSNNPLGFGVGSAGNWAQRFYQSGPEILKYTDGLYISVWMQTGILGLSIKIILILILAVYLGILIARMKNQSHKNIGIALYAPFCGLMVADFANNLSTQLPSGVIVPITLAIIFLLAEGKITEHPAHLKNQKTLK